MLFLLCAAFLGGRYELVERNSNIVLEYKNNYIFALHAQDKVTGYSGEQKPLVVEIDSKHLISHIEWRTQELEAAGGVIISSSPDHHTVTLPDLRDGDDAKNTYIIYGIAIDSRGNRSSESQTLITVKQSDIDPSNSGLDRSVFSFIADGASKQTVTLSLPDSAGNMVDVDQAEIFIEGKYGNKKQIKPRLQMLL